MQGWARVVKAMNVWLALLLFGAMLIGAGLGEAFLEAARHTFLAGAFIDAVTLRFLGKFVQGAVVFGIGVVIAAIAIRQLRRSPFGLTLSLVERQPMVDLVYSNPGGQGLPTAIVFSGHMGLLIMLSALRDSVGRLIAVPPAGSDYRTISRLVHTSYPDVRVLSATAENVELRARLTTGEVLIGAATIERDARSGIAELSLSSGGSEPSPQQSWPTNQELAQAISAANLIVFGPGSFYTSVLPTLLIPGVRERVASSGATTVFVCNVMTEPGRTDGYTVTDFILRFREYAGFAPDYTIVNRSYPGNNILTKYEVTGSFPVLLSPDERMEGSRVILGQHLPGTPTTRIGGSVVIEADITRVISEDRLTFDPEGGTATQQTFTVIRHDSEKLGLVMRNIIGQSRTRQLGA